TMSDLLGVGETYRADEMSPSDWNAHVAELRDGDVVEYWIGGLGYRKMVFHDDPGDTREWHEFTVLSRVPRGPEWDGARVVIDADGDVWAARGDRYYRPRGTYRGASSLEAEYGPCRVLLDADGRVPVGTVAALNTKTTAYQAVYHAVCSHWRDGTVPDADRITGAVLRVLGGGSDE